MTDKDKKFSEAFLFSGKDLALGNGVSVKHPTIEDILGITGDEKSFEIYISLANLLMCDPYNYMVMLDDMGIDYSTQDCFDVFLMQWKQSIDNYKKNPEFFEQNHLSPVYNIVIALQFFLGKHNFKVVNIKDNDGSIIPAIIDIDSVKDNQCGYVIDRNMFNKMAEFISAINCIDKSKQIHPKNDNFKKLLIDDMRDEIKKNSKKHNDTNYSDYIGKIMEALCFCGNGGINTFNINQVHLYQLLIGFNKFIKKDNVDHLMNGQYDLSKISKSELNWFD